MSVPSQAGLFAIAPQKGKIGDSTFNSSAYSFYKMRATAVSIGTKQIQEIFPLELGGKITPTGAYKSGVFVQGDVEFIPRLEESLGWILRAALGEVTTTEDAVWHPTLGTVATDVAGTAIAGVNTHLFKFSPVSYDQPWMAIRATTPGSSAAKIWGEEGYDLKVGALRLNIPGAGLGSAVMSLQGRCPKYNSQATTSAWSFANAAFEQQGSAAIGGRNTNKFLIGGERLPIVGATIDLRNNLTPPQQEMVFGSYYPDDVVALTRDASIRFVLKWDNPDLYRKVLNGGSPTSNDWDANPYITSTAGAVKAFEVLIESLDNIAGSSPAQKYKLRIIANKVAWEVDPNGIRLGPGDIVMVPFIGTVMDDDTNSYIDFVIENHATYTNTGPNIPPFLYVANTDISTPAASSILVAPSGMVADNDSANLDTGVLTVTKGGDAVTADGLDVVNSGLVTVATNNVSYNGTVVGVKAGGTAATPLTVTFDADATPEAVSAVMKAVQFSNDTTHVSGDISSVLFTLTDGDSGTSNTVVVYVRTP